jgi:hypothetical protein
MYFNNMLAIKDSQVFDFKRPFEMIIYTVGLAYFQLRQACELISSLRDKEGTKDKD